MKPLRLWPGVVIGLGVVVLRFVVPSVFTGGLFIGSTSAVIGGALMVLWWLLFSRAAWTDRFLALALFAAAILVTLQLAHPSVTAMAPLVLIPATLVPAFVTWAVLAGRTSPVTRRVTMTIAIMLGCGFWTLVRTDGVIIDEGAQLSWRFRPSAEERLLAETPLAPVSPPAPSAPTVPVPAPGARKTDAAPPSPRDYGVARVTWSGFRGTHRDSIIRDTNIRTDWTSAPPKELWRHRVGPGWSSFAVAGDLVFTQEQRGEFEVVSAYRLSTGEPVWQHKDKERFYEAAGGAGPRGTPAVHNGRVYTMGATGIVNALDATTGATIWTRNAETDTGATRPDWGYAASPIVINDLVIAAASGRMVAYDLETGGVRWTLKTPRGGYSSPHFATIDGVDQILLQKGGGVTSVALDGTILWEDAGDDGVAMLQPVLLGNRSLLVATGGMLVGNGVRRLEVSKGADGTWKVEERWTTRGLKPYFNDYVAHKGHAYGFDGTILSAINLDTGERVWKGGRYGNGQLVLLPAQDLLLLISEDGDLVLVAAHPDKHTELARFKAIEGKTWNHPVLVGDVLLARNGEEMAAFRLPR